MGNRKLWSILSGLTVLAVSIIWIALAGAQSNEVKAKPPMYSFIAVWNIPQDHYLNYSSESATFTYHYGAGRNLLTRNSLIEGQQATVGPWDLILVEENQ